MDYRTPTFIVYQDTQELNADKNKIRIELQLSRSEESLNK